MPIISSSQAHLTHVGTLSGPGTRPDIRPVGSGSPAEEPAHRPGFPVAFRPTGVGFLGHPVPPGNYAFLTVGRPDTCRYPDPDGVSTFHVHETRPGGVPSRPRDGGALPTDAESSVGTRRFPAASPHPLSRFPSAGLNLTGHHRGFTYVHPSGLPLACGPRMEREPLGFISRSFAPRRYQRRTSRQGRALSTGPGLRSRHQHRSALLPASPLIARHRTRPRVARRLGCWSAGRAGRKGSG